MIKASKVKGHTGEPTLTDISSTYSRIYAGHKNVLREIPDRFKDQVAKLVMQFDRDERPYVGLITWSGKDTFPDIKITEGNPLYNGTVILVPADEVSGTVTTSTGDDFGAFTRLIEGKGEPGKTHNLVVILNRQFVTLPTRVALEVTTAFDREKARAKESFRSSTR